MDDVTEYDFTLPEGWEITYEVTCETPKCDCGAVIANAPIHSDWCSTKRETLLEEEEII